jgi:hypothetical protein
MKRRAPEIFLLSDYRTPSLKEMIQKSKYELPMPFFNRKALHIGCRTNRKLFCRRRNRKKVRHRIPKLV